MTVQSAALAAAAFLALNVGAAHAEQTAQASTEQAAPARLAFLGLGGRKPQTPIAPAPQTAPPGEQAAEGGERGFRLNPSLTQPLEMPVGRRPQRLLPTRA